MAKNRSFFVVVFGSIWKVWDFLCRIVINLLVTLIVLVIALASLGGHHLVVPSSAALVVDIQGDLVDQFSGDPAQRAVARVLGQRDEHPQTRMRDVLGAIEAAKDDDRIKALVLETDQMEGAGLAKLQEVARAVDDFKKTGKPVFALGDSYDQAQYYLAAQADTIFIHPQGNVFLHGFGVFQPYFKDALDKYGVQWNVFRVGKYKSAVEPFLRNDMSPEAREEYGKLLGDLWTDYQRDIVKARKLKSGAVQDYIANLDNDLAAENGDGAALALKARLVDRIAEPDQMQAAVEKVVGTSNHSFRSVDFRDYVSDDGLADVTSPHVAVIVAEGDVMNGDQPPGVIGGDSTSELLREARYDDSVKAVVLQVDSPGGSSFASDLILREVALLRQANKPVVISMGDVAASGGYWISMAGDEIFASPDTITGSIGIFGMLPTFQGTLAKVGVHTDGLGTTPFSDAFDVTRDMSPEMKQAFQLVINNGYQDFITKVAHYRDMKPEQVDAIAQGRVWSGQDAQRLGLVDHFGGLAEAETAAAKLAHLGTDYTVTYIEKQPTLGDRLLMSLANDTDQSGKVLLSQSSLPGWYSQVLGAAKSLSVFNDPHGIYSYCFCGIR